MRGTSTPDTHAAAERLLIAVTAGDGGRHALCLCGFGLTWSVSVPFRLEPGRAAAEACEPPARP